MSHPNHKRKYGVGVVDLISSDEDDGSHAQQRKQPRATEPSDEFSNPRDSWAEASSEVDSTQDTFDDNVYQTFQLYGVLNTKIVGVRYYNGHATPGELVIVRREPSNPYDVNAIRVDNVMGHQIGHVPRGMASKLAPFMDFKSLIVEGSLSGHKDYFDAPVAFKLYGTSDPAQAAALKQKMKDAKLPTSELIQAEREEKRRQKEEEQRKKHEHKRLLKEAASQAGAGRKGAQREPLQDKSTDFANLTGPNDGTTQDSGPDMDEIMGHSVQFNPREIGEVVSKYGSGEDVLASLPLAEQPADLITPLLPYQKQGLAWMLAHESPFLPERGSRDTTQLWKCNSSGSYTNIATNFVTSKTPGLASGGILADDMGLGKTIQVISLLLADPHRTNQPTLIISPLSVVSNWSYQAQIHMRPEKALKVLIYHENAKKEKNAENLEQYDVVVTTYQTLAREYMTGPKPKPIPRPCGLYSLNWRRVVVDEGHNIRNPKAKMAQAACALMASSRWILTGTLIVNNLKDLYSHIRFLRLTGGLEQQEIFSSALIRPLNQGRSDASTLLQALISTLCLRRMKDMKFIDLRLPELDSHLCSVSFRQHEREKYEAFQQEAKGLLLNFQSKNKDAKGQSTYSHLLEVLLRLRQTCNHWKLCGDRTANLMALLEENKKVSLTPENLQSLRDLLQISIDSHEECPICYDQLHNPCITTCAHVFGGECIERVIETQQRCPMCRAELSDKLELVHPAAEDVTVEPGIDANTPSSKVEALMNLLQASQKKNPDTKTVLFSQWTSFLDIVQHQLEKHGFNFCRLDGTMNASRRDGAMDSLANDPECTVMLASLSVCSVGLNLVAANQVILADSWWAPAIEDQAIDRVHRLGQKRPVTVFRLVMEDSIEERVLEIQQDKRKLTMTAFQEKTMKRGTEKSARMADIERLLT